MSADAIGAVFKHSPYTGVPFTVHLAIADSVNDINDNELWATQTRIANKARTTRSTASKAIATMVSDGLLVVLEDNSATGKPNRYRFIAPEGGVSIEHTQGVSVEHRGCVDTTQGGVSVEHTEPNKEPKIGTLSDLPTLKQIRDRTHTYPTEFEEAWRAYPRHPNPSKLNSYVPWRARIEEATKQGVSRERRAQALAAAVRMYVRDLEGTDRLVMNAATFFGPKERWVSYARQALKPGSDKPVDDYDDSGARRITKEEMEERERRLRGNG